MFCPECGKALANAAREVEPPAAAEISNSALAPSTSPEPVAAREVQSPPTSVEVAGSAADPETSPNKSEPDQSASRHGVRERTREGLHRASTAARGALEDNVKRVEKIHHVSTAMFEEAHYDPSLRFVLVALGLFVVFVILLVLSKVMG